MDPNGIKSMHKAMKALSALFFRAYDNFAAGCLNDGGIGKITSDGNES